MMMAKLLQLPGHHPLPPSSGMINLIKLLFILYMITLESIILPCNSLHYPSNHPSSNLSSIATTIRNRRGHPTGKRHSPSLSLIHSPSSFNSHSLDLQKNDAVCCPEKYIFPPHTHMCAYFCIRFTFSLPLFPQLLHRFSLPLNFSMCISLTFFYFSMETIL